MSGSDSSFTKIGGFGVVFTSFFMWFRLYGGTPSSDVLSRIDFVEECWTETASMVLWKFKPILGAYCVRVGWLLAHSVLIVSQYFLSPKIYVPYFEANMLRTPGCRSQISNILHIFPVHVFITDQPISFPFKKLWTFFVFIQIVSFHFRVLYKVFRAQSGNILWNQWPLQRFYLIIQ